jgi:hypothetical protein
MNDIKGGRKKLIMADIMGGRMLLRKKGRCTGRTM